MHFSILLGQTIVTSGILRRAVIQLTEVIMIVLLKVIKIKMRIVKIIVINKNNPIKKYNSLIIMMFIMRF